MRYLAQIGVIFLLWSSIVTGRELTFCHVEMPPYSYIGSDGQAAGIKVQLLHDIVDRIDGVEASVEFLPWGRCLDYVRSGEVDGVLPLFHNVEREEFMAFSVPLFHQEIRFWYNRAQFPDGLDWSGDFDELLHLRLGQLSHSFLGAELRAAFEADGGIVHATQLQGLMRMLLTGRVNLFVTDHLIGLYYTRKNGWSGEIAPVARPVSSLPTQFGLSRASGASEFREAFDRAIQALQADGVVERRLQLGGLDG